MNLDDINAIKQLDSQNMVSSIVELPLQVKQTWEEIHELTIPEDFKNINNIVFAGMGGSALGAYVAKHLYGLTLSYSFEIIDDYHLPLYVDESTLVIT